MLKYFLCWLPMIMIAVINGTAREWYKRYLGDLAAHQLSTVSLIILLGFYISFIVKKYPPASGTQVILLGLFWMVLALSFEFGFGLWRGNSWGKLLEDYNLMKGHLWILVPVWVAIAPYLAYKIQNPQATF